MTQKSIVVSTTPPLPGLSLVNQVNDALEALGTDFAGATDPAAFAKAYMTWADTGNLLLKRRNAANGAWVTLGPLLGAVAEQGGGANYAIDTGSANTITASLAPAITALTDGMVVRIKIKTLNTGATTLGLNALGATPVLGLAGVALQGGELPANGRATLMYSATSASWILLNCENGAMQVKPSTASAHAVAQSQVFGVGQTRQDVSASRTDGATYTNSTGKPITVCFAGQTSSGGGSIFGFCNNKAVASAMWGALDTVLAINFIVLPGETYKCTSSNMAAGSRLWLEIRE